MTGAPPLGPVRTRLIGRFAQSSLAVIMVVPVGREAVILSTLLRSRLLSTDEWDSDHEVFGNDRRSMFIGGHGGDDIVSA